MSFCRETDIGTNRHDLFQIKVASRKSDCISQKENNVLDSTLHTLQHIFMFKTLLRVLNEIVHL